MIAEPAKPAASVEVTPSTHGTVSADSGAIVYTPDAGFTGAASYDYTVCEQDGEDCTTGTVQLTVTPTGVVADDVRATPLDQAGPTSLFAATAFLYTGANPLQHGVAPGTIERARAAVVRGMVRSATGEPLAGATVSIWGHPELGYTVSRDNGMFDLAVNGGGPLTVSYGKEGLAPTHRQVTVPWGDYTWLPDVALAPLGGATTLSGTDLETLRSLPTASGALMVAARTRFDAVLPTGAARRLDTVSLGATPYPAGSVPAPPPDDRAPAYVFDVRVDEAARAGARQVRINKPLVQYLENLTGQPTGEDVALSQFDWSRTAWVPAPAGRVVTVTGVANGKAQLDHDAGASAAELAELARLYPVGTSLWRLTLTGPGTWAAGTAGVATADVPVAPPAEPPARGAGDGEGTMVAVAGTPFSLRAPADPATSRKLAVPVTGDPVPAGLTGVDVEVVVAGSRHTTTLPPDANQTYELTWDGKDGYGRVAPGTFRATVTVTYQLPGGARPSRTSTATLGAVAGPSAGLNGWRVGPQAVLDADRLVVSDGDGDAPRTLRAAEPAALTDLRADAVATGPDGSLYVSGGNQVRRIDPFGNATLVAGSGTEGFGGDGGPAVRASFRGPGAVAVGADGGVYVVDTGNRRVRRVAPNGIISTVAGNGSAGGRGLGRPAATASIGAPTDLVVAPNGTVFILDGEAGRVLELGLDGILRERAALAAGGLAIAVDGALLASDPTRGRIVRLDGGGRTTTVAALGLVHPGALAAGNDGSLAVVDGQRVVRLGGPQAQVVDVPGAADVALGPDGVLHVRGGGARVADIGRSLATSTPTGEIAVPSADGKGSLVFDMFGRHLRTVDAATGTVLTTFRYDGDGQLRAIEDATLGTTTIERDAATGTVLRSPAGPRTTVPGTARPPVPTIRGIDIPAVALAAYRKAADTARRATGCDIRWSVLAAIARTESNHGRLGKAAIQPNGDVVPAVVGIPLNGSAGTERIPDTDGGALDGDTTWDRAVGPLQFIPSTWRMVASDGNGDGVADVNNLFDSSAAAARYLCQAAPSGRVGDRDQLAKALFSYNRSAVYVTAVLADVDLYDSFDPAFAGHRLPAGTFSLPIDRAFIDADPGMLARPHHDYAAIDLPVPEGARVYAVAAGTVVAVDPGGDCGKGVIVDSAAGYRYTYCHALRSLAAAGEEVTPGEVVMLAGSTGHSSGPHVHLQIARPDGTKICPQALVQAWYRGQPAPPASAPTRGCWT